MTAKALTNQIGIADQLGDGVDGVKGADTIIRASKMATQLAMAKQS